MAKKKIIPKTLKPVNENIALEKEFTKKLTALTADVNKSFSYWSMATARKNLDKNLSKQLSFNFTDLLNDWEKKINPIAKKMSNDVANKSKKYVDLVMVKQNPSFAMKRTPKQVSQALNGIYERNYNLIKSIPQDIKNRFEQTFLNNVSNFDQEAIFKQVKSIEGISQRRAKSIARDQSQKAVSQYHAVREQNLGFEYYMWQTSKDERVSTGAGGHKKLQGRIYRYDTPTAVIDSYGNVGHPSERVNCRCRRRAVLLEPNQTVKKVKDSAGDYYVIVEK